MVQHQNFGHQHPSLAVTGAVRERTSNGGSGVT
jgi:hypothetical protein